MAKLSGSIDVPLPPEEAWKHASDLSRFKDWLTIHKVWRSKLPDVLEKGTVLESYVEVKGMPNRIKWTIVHYKPPEAMTLNGDGVGGVKVKLIAKVAPKDGLMDSALEMAGKIAEMPPHALRIGKSLIRHGQTASYDNLMEMSALAQAVSHLTEDHEEGVKDEQPYKRAPDTRAMREPWWGPHPSWSPIVCRRRPRPRAGRRLGWRTPFFRG